MAALVQVRDGELLADLGRTRSVSSSASADELGARGWSCSAPIESQDAYVDRVSRSQSVWLAGPTATLTIRLGSDEGAI